MNEREEDNVIVLLEKSNIIRIVRTALSKIDPRLVDHGERVGYIASIIADEANERIDKSKLSVLSLFHDVGAYKTDEIDNMVTFETEQHFDHSVYGYCFLKYASPLTDWAQAILYHHTDYDSELLSGSKRAKYAALINLADRADILISIGKTDFSAIEKLSGTKFNPKYVNALLAAENRCGIIKKIQSGEYAVESERLFEKVKIRQSEIMDYLKLLVYAIDFRSPYTVTHTVDTTIFASEIGKLMHVSQHELDAMYVGAFLHDIGKIAIPQSILEKPGRLTPEEFTLIKEHINEGEQILRGVVSDEICNIALRHHEKLDGSGYPLGLKEVSLTLPERIVAVADILSALSQRRSYKPPFEKEKVIGILCQMRDDGQLCAEVVDTVCENYDVLLGKTEDSHNPVKHIYDKIIKEYVRQCKRMGCAPPPALIGASR